MLLRDGSLFRWKWDNRWVLMLMCCHYIAMMPHVFSSHLSDNTPIKVFILAGQSNMSGRASADSLTSHPADEEILYHYHFDPKVGPRTFVRSEVAFEKLQSHLGTFGPEMGFARTLYDAGQRNIALIKVSVGGTDLYEDWKKGNQYLYERLIEEVRVALRRLEQANRPYQLAALCWMQGESDTQNKLAAEQYEANLISFIEHVRKDLHEPKLPIYIAKIKYSTERAHQEAVRWAQHRVGSWDPYAACFHTDDLPTQDGTHYNVRAQLTLGRRFAEAYLEQQFLAKRPIQNRKYEVVVYGATPAGIASAIHAAQQGVSVGLFEASGHLGGMMTAGMGNPDFKTFEALGGFYQSFMDSVLSYYTKVYGAESQQVKDCYGGVWYEPKVASTIFGNMLAAHKNIDIHLFHALKEVKMVQLKDLSADLREIYVETRIEDSISKHILRIEGKVFIDATYEGDLMAKAGCAYRVGRESRSTYGELFAGVKYYDKGQFLMYSSGKADQKVQSYNFRLCMTNDSANRVAIEKPTNYDRNTYLPLLTLIQNGKVKSVAEGVVRFRYLPNRKADVNDIMYSPFSLRLVGENYGWPDGSAEVRQGIFDRHKAYTIGLFYFLQHDEELPEDIREEALMWGWPKDEFKGTNHFPPILYVREARRMIGRYVLTEHDTQPSENQVRANLHQDAVAICDYSMDSHGNGPEISAHPGITEGVFNRYVVPFQLPYQIMLPSRVNRLIVPVAVSSSHVGFSSLRMEPSWCALGQAAGIAAGLAVQQDKNPQELAVSEIQTKLHQQKALTIYISDIPTHSPLFKACQYFGTSGFFHELPEYKEVPYVGRGKKGNLLGQYIQAYPYHALHPKKAMDVSLAHKWIQMAQTEDFSQDYTQMNRGDFLLALFEQLRPVD